MPTLIELDNFEANVELCRELELDFVELNMNLPEYQPGSIGKLKLPEDVGVTLHLPEELNVWDFNPVVRSAYLETVRAAVSFCIANNVPVMNMHMNRGVYFTLPDKKVFLFERYGDEFLGATEEFAKMTAGLLKGTGIACCIENTGIYQNVFIAKAVDIVLEYDCFHLTWDIGHDYSSGCADTEFMKKRCGRIAHVHLHDAKGVQNHLPLGTGEIDLTEIIGIIHRNKASAVLETKTAAGLRESCRYKLEKGL